MLTPLAVLTFLLYTSYSPIEGLFLISLLLNILEYSGIPTLTFSNVNWQVEEALMPILFSFFPTWKPSVSRSTKKQVMPLYPWKDFKCDYTWTFVWLPEPTL